MTPLTEKRRAPITTRAGEVYYAQIRARGKDANHRLTLRITDGDNTIREYAYFVPTQDTDVYLPFVATGKERFCEAESCDGGEFYTDRPRVEKSSYEYNKTRSGTYLADTENVYCETITAGDKAGLIHGRADDGTSYGYDRTLDFLIRGEYMYAICNGRIHTLCRSGESFEHIDATEHLGEIRQMAFTSDGRGIAVTARNFGLYTVDITDPEHPKVACHYDSLEMATGLDVFGKYLFVADRTFGVDIIDISDIYHPVFISNIPTGETQNVCYSNGYVYAGVWAECKVRVCDVHSLDDPREVCEINLSGRGDGVFVKDGILYAATGQFPLGAHKDRYNPGYGLGCGLEIWDVHEPTSPRRLSVIRSDGACYPGNPDLWRTYTAGNYLFFSSTFSGAYVYDVSDKSAPRRLCEYQILAESEKNEYWNEKFVFPYPRGVDSPDARKPYPVVDTLVDGDRLYLGTGLYGSGNNLYEARLPFFAGEPDENDSAPDSIPDSYSGSYYRPDYTGLLPDLMAYTTDSQIRAAAVEGDYLYLAAGMRGVVVLDKRTMREVGSVPTFDITKDVKIKDGYLYTAESQAGVAVYMIDADDPAHLTLVGQNAVANVVELMLSPDARFAVAHISNVQGLIDLRDKTEPRLYYFNREFHMVYQHQISIGTIADRYLTVSATKGKIQVYDFGEGGSYPEPEISLILDSTPISGMCALGDSLFITSGKNTYLTSQEALNLTRPLCNPDFCRGIEGILPLPVIHGDLLFSVLRKSGGYSILRLDRERMTASTVFSHRFRANPGITVTDGERFYLPLGYGGIISFKL